jgi:hypothetical protein
VSLRSFRAASNGILAFTICRSFADKTNWWKVKSPIAHGCFKSFVAHDVPDKLIEKHVITFS